MNDTVELDRVRATFARLMATLEDSAAISAEAQGPVTSLEAHLAFSHTDRQFADVAVCRTEFEKLLR